jgi:methionine-gamma-lyase
MKNELSPETTAIHGGFDPARSEGAAKVPLFTTSTFVAENAEDLAHSFDQAYGVHGVSPCNPSKLVYGRLAHPNGEIAEGRLSYFEGAEEAALFSSGMGSIKAVCDTFLRPGAQVLVSSPVYGGSDFLFKKFLPGWGVESTDFSVTSRPDEVAKIAASLDKLALVFVETPANPTLELADLPGIVRVIRSTHPEAIICVDNTLLGPIFQKVIPLGVDLSLFSATKSIGGHSDLIAGLVMGKSSLVHQLKGTRTIGGAIISPHSASLLTRSIETLKVRVEAAEAKAKKVYSFLDRHEKVRQVLYPGFGNNQEQLRRFEEQCTGHGSLMSFRIDGGQDAAYKLLNALKVVKLAVSLGSTESLAEHPRTHTHADVSLEDQDKFGITEDLVRLSVGLEDADDVINDLDQALSAMEF